MALAGTVKTVAVHDVVQRVYPRPPVTERDERGMAEGKAIDGALSRFSHEFAQGRRPTVTAILRYAEATFEDELRDAHLELSDAARLAFLAKARELLRLFRSSELFGLPRPRTRLLLIDGDAGVYAQPDFWNGRDRIYELKSYRAHPPAPDILLQLDLFQLAYPGFVEVLACLDRHASPATLTLHPIALVLPDREREILALARTTALETGTEKVLRYVDSPVIRRNTRTPD
ncbi:MAG TPA: hypothetical protein VFG07_09540 [Thermoplasmata archaeon]|nr:hypothetical protein [Thermoplasmata archaeon]